MENVGTPQNSDFNIAEYNGLRNGAGDIDQEVCVFHIRNL